ncbi:NADH:flavin oxidoreductase [Halorarius litoreus]|uniref:oxidoreductase n=1 Tax=Halorarius litoreus TaxID=2962676 RepID=UPI0020CF92A9|nr:NADH:flavin oxidoreductase [Halorarius litoreus]
MVVLDDPVTVGGCPLPNRLYRAPLLECAGTGEGAVDRLIHELEPAAASGVGLVFQGASIVTEEGGCAVPNMTRVHDPAFVAALERLTGTVHDHGGRIFLQLAHGGLRSRSLWHRGYGHEGGQLAVSRPPATVRALDRVGLLSLDAHVLSTAEVEDLAEAFGRAAGLAVDAGYDGIHLSGANMGIVQQFLSPQFNRRDDAFSDGVRFLELVHDSIRDHAGDVPLVTKVPAETQAPRWVRRRLERDEAVDICARLAAYGYDGLVPVEVSTFWDMSIVRGAYPARAWADDGLRAGYQEAWGPYWRLVALLNRWQSLRFEREPGWNAAFCRLVRERVDVPVFCEGGLRERVDCDRLLGDACDLVGMARPFYAEPRLGKRLLGDEDAGALCASCNNCTVPQVTGAEGRCRTPSVVRERARREQAGEYD